MKSDRWNNYHCIRGRHQISSMSARESTRLGRSAVRLGTQNSAA